MDLVTLKTNSSFVRNAHTNVKPVLKKITVANVTEIVSKNQIVSVQKDNMMKTKCVTFVVINVDYVQI